MKVGVRLYGTDPDGLVFVARKFEQLGFDSIWRGEHIVVPTASNENYPYHSTNQFDGATPVLECLTVLSYLAAVTSRLKLAIGICVVPLREPYLLARCATTLDILSGGRLIFGVGAGWLEGEFKLIGADFHKRGVVTTETILALKALWTETSPEYRGTLVSVGGCRLEPKPVSKPHPPIVVGGESAAALRRAGSVGDGWYGHGTNLAQTRERLQLLASFRKEAGRDKLPFEVSIRVRPEVATDDVLRLRDMGVDRIVLEVGSLSLQESRAVLPEVEDFSDRIFQALEMTS